MKQKNSLNLLYLGFKKHDFKKQSEFLELLKTGFKVNFITK